MAKRKAAGQQKGCSAGEENLDEARKLIWKNAFMGNLSFAMGREREKDLGRGIVCKVYRSGIIYVNPEEELTPRQWANTLMHCRLHLCFGHFDADKMPGYETRNADGRTQKTVTCNIRIWNLACDAYITRFMQNLQFGESIVEYPFLHKIRESADEQEIYDYLMETGEGQRFEFYMDMVGLEEQLVYDGTSGKSNRYAELFTRELSRSVFRAVDEVGGHTNRNLSFAQRAAAWFMDCYPLLGSIASAYQIVDDPAVCVEQEIQIAAVDVTEGIIYINPAVRLTQDEMKFVLAHEFLHAGLQHQQRCQGRDFYIWNVACDFVINGWLTEMQIGTMPEGCLYDNTLKNLSAEEIYDLLVSDIKNSVKLKTFRGNGMGDMLGNSIGKKKNGLSGVSLDEFCRKALMQGLEYHQRTKRGYIPEGMVQEIRALAMPPIPWHVALGQWFEQMFPLPEKKRSYARPGRRQGATPDIPRPRYIEAEEKRNQHTFGVVLDTSGSMSVKMIGMALGSIASYAASREIPYTRVIFCDAAAYDAGYLTPEGIAGKVQVKGRGGTVLQPGIDLLEHSDDFPKDAPILIITDTEIEPDLKVHRTHAFLIPQGKVLPFRVRKNGEVFQFTEKSS